jgi:hypothetical protein
MGDGTSKNPFIIADIYMLKAQNGNVTEGLDLSGKVFEKGIDLHEIDLTGDILDGAVLNGAVLKEAGLENCHLKGARLIGANLEGAFLEGAHLENTNLSRAHLENADLSGAQLGNAKLTAAHLEGAELFDANLEESFLVNAFLDGTNLSKAHLQGAYMHGAKFSASTEMASADWGNYILGEEIEGENTDKRYLLKWSGETYRRLKTWYTEHSVHDKAAEFYYREKEANRKSLKWRSKSTFWHRLTSEFARAFFGYGEKWNRILIWMAAVVFGLGGAYCLWGSFSSSSFSDTLYYSATSFTALGYGHWAPQPAGWAKGMGVAEAFLGVFMMALLLVTFVRKWTR